MHPSAHPSSAPKGRDAGPRSRVRTCVGCGGQAEQAQLLRWAYDPELGLSVDVRGVAGRGAWLHPSPQCVQRAVHSGFSKSFKSRVQTTPAAVCELVRSAAVARFTGLLQAARSSRKLVFGRDQVRACVEIQRDLEEGRGNQPSSRTQNSGAPGSVELALLAEDAGSLANEQFVSTLAAHGKLCIWGNKDLFGQWLGRGEVAILAFIDNGFAGHAAHTLALSRLAPPCGERSSAEQSASLLED